MQDNIQLPEKLIKAFPTRELQLTPLKGDGGIIRLIFLVLVLIGLTVLLLFNYLVSRMTIKLVKMRFLLMPI